jgi:hypothetical protein
MTNSEKAALAAHYCAVSAAHAALRRFAEASVAPLTLLSTANPPSPEHQARSAEHDRLLREAREG